MALRWLAVVALLFAASTSAVAEPIKLSTDYGDSYTNGLAVGRVQSFQERTRRLGLASSSGVNGGEANQLELVVDYHPEVDRWTERNNRIRLTPYIGAWFYSNELDIENNVALGLRLSWETPGFISIRFETAFSPFSRLKVKPGGSPNPSSTRHADGTVTNAYLSVAIFNPELSSAGLAWWAGLGTGAWIFDFNESAVQGRGTRTDVSFNEVTPAAKLFLEVDYKITPTLHVGFGVAEHILYASFTDKGRFYNVNGVQGGTGGGGVLVQNGRNDGLIGHLALITEVTFNLSLVF